MKKLISVIIVIMLSAPVLFAQETLKEVVRDYQRNNSEYTFVIPSFLIKMGLAFGEMEDEEREVLEMIDDMKIVICENNFKKGDFSILDNGIKNGTFSELMTVNDGGDKVRMIMNQKSKQKSELLMIVEGVDNENVMMLFDFHGEPDFRKFISMTD